MQIIAANLENGSQAEVTSFCHKLKNSYLVSNYELIRFVFNWSEQKCWTCAFLVYWIDILFE